MRSGCEKESWDGNILETQDLMKKEEQNLLNEDGVPKNPDRRLHAQEEDGSMSPTLSPFVRPGRDHRNMEGCSIVTSRFLRSSS